MSVIIKNGGNIVAYYRGEKNFNEIKKIDDFFMLILVCYK